jgi:hypothetical protein
MNQYRVEFDSLDGEDSGAVCFHGVGPLSLARIYATLVAPVMGAKITDVKVAECPGLGGRGLVRLPTGRWSYHGVV